MTPHDRALELPSLAKQHERAAHVLQRHPDVSDRVVSFHYQQATEKLLKALLAERNVDVPRTHDLMRLTELTREAGYEIVVLEDDVERLTPLAVTLRHEDGEVEQRLDRIRVEGLVAGLLAWVERQLGYMRTMHFAPILHRNHRPGTSRSSNMAQIPRVDAKSDPTGFETETYCRRIDDSMKRVRRGS